ncbi:MAG: class I SAM-dependent methyltransferase [Actinomycetota bacterium]|nr:class I SAM-dependent methyltransferase [Actinomycetota bacterium]
MPDMHAHHHHDEPGSPIGFTGERVLPDIPEWAWCFQAHLFGYEDLLRRLAPNAHVLEIGCGEGYGAARLSTKAAEVVATDVAPDAVAHARSKYLRKNLTFVTSDAKKLPFADHSFDVVCSLQVIEHFTDTDVHLSEVARVLRPGGWHYVTTPNIDKMGEAEKENPYHFRDFTALELQHALERHFADVTLEGMFYVEDSPRYRAMQQAEAKEARLRPKVKAIEKTVARLPGAVRVRARAPLRALIGVHTWPLPEAEAARNAIRAEDFYAGTPAEDSFCLIGVAQK